MAKKWIVTVPYKGVANIPVESDEEPVILSNPQVASRLHTNFMDWGMPEFFRRDGKVEETDDDYYETIYKRAEREFNKKSSVSSCIRRMASDLLNHK